MAATEDVSLVEQCHEALEDVTDPELPISVVDLGLIYQIDIEGGHADVDMTLTAMGCPAAGLITGEVRERLLELDGVDSADVEIVWDPVWTKDKMTDKGKQQLRCLGIAV
ncbi:metal-sulfur cluster assembly factor [Haloarchaeobius sp. TZWSO28]|uniref:metal-sulfur cluster assembly factor n=1 Tax=unclassified Haloarchaeobius TaxID=2614452 RepID=UPI003EBB1FF2